MRKIVVALLASGVLVAAVAAGAGAAKPPWAGGGKSKPAVTKMRFKLMEHEVEIGETVEGNVLVQTGKGRNREPLDGATLRVLVDKVEVDTLTTDADGRAAVAYVVDAEGEHVMKVIFGGDDAQKKAKRAQGFEVGPADTSEEE